MPISPALAITGSYRIQTAKISFCANALICDARSRKTPSASSSILYRVPEILTLGRFPDARESDSTWRTQEVRHVGSDTIAPRFWCVPAAWFGEEDERRPPGPSASSARRNL